MFQWRKFPFFDKDVVKLEGLGGTEEKREVKENEETAETPLDSRFDLSKLLINCSSSGRGRLVFGDILFFLFFITYFCKKINSTSEKMENRH